MNKTLRDMLIALRRHCDGGTEETAAGTWADVYLDNVRGTLSAAQFGGRLSALEDLGLYRPSENGFGQVLLEPNNGGE